MNKIIILKLLGLLLIGIGVAMVADAKRAAPAYATNYTVEINEQDGSAVVYVENYEAIAEDKEGLRIKKKGEE